jgi:hypothetical protein
MCWTKQVIGFDAAVNRFFRPYRTPLLFAVCAWIAELGSSATLTLIAIVTTGFLWTLGRGFLILPL